MEYVVGGPFWTDVIKTPLNLDGKDAEEIFDKCFSLKQQDDDNKTFCCLIRQHLLEGLGAGFGVVIVFDQSFLFGDLRKPQHAFLRWGLTFVGRTLSDEPIVYRRKAVFFILTGHFATASDYRRITLETTKQRRATAIDALRHIRRWAEGSSKLTSIWQFWYDCDCFKFEATQNDATTQHRLTEEIFITSMC